MPRYIAFLRGINLGKRRLSMSRLVEIFEHIGHTEVKTFIASGNVLFQSPSKNTRALETAASRHLQQVLGYDVDVFIRTAEQVAAIARTKHFPQDGQEGVVIHVGFVQEPFAADTKKRLEAIRTSLDEFKVAEREFYWLCHSDRSSDSTIWGSPEIKALRLPSATMRNLKSIRKLAAQHLG